MENKNFNGSAQTKTVTKVSIKTKILVSIVIGACLIALFAIVNRIIIKKQPKNYISNICSSNSNDDCPYNDPHDLSGPDD